MSKRRSSAQAKESKPCLRCGTVFTSHVCRRRNYCSRSCSKQGRTGLRNNAWKGGRFIHKQSGRTFVRVGNHYELEHRTIIARTRKLDSSDVVHHIDEDYTNNSPENLLVMRRGDHIALHNYLSPRLNNNRDRQGRFREKQT